MAFNEDLRAPLKQFRGEHAAIFASTKLEQLTQRNSTLCLLASFHSRL